MDIKTAFLNGFIDKEIYMEIPDSVNVDFPKTKVCKLIRSLYGLK